MPNYTKLFNSIVTSTIWTEDDKTRILWITMLAMADQNGEVHASIPGLARIAGIDIPATEKALALFLGPDPYSRTPDNEGRRIAPIKGGWELLNHAKYRKMASKEDSKAATAERVRRFRERENGVTPCNAPVTPCNGAVTVGRDIAEAEAEAEAKAKTILNNTPLTPQGGKESRKRERLQKPTPEQVDAYVADKGYQVNGHAFVDHYEAKGWKIGNQPMKDWQAAVRTWHRRNEESKTPAHRQVGYQERLELP